MSREYYCRLTNKGNPSGDYLSINPYNVDSVYVSGGANECGVLMQSGVTYRVEGSVNEVTRKLEEAIHGK